MQRVIKILILPVISALFLTGCVQSRQVENQAYVIALGVDISQSGDIELTAKIPVLSASSEDKSSSGDSYKDFSATGSSYNTALNQLHNASPRNLNLSHLELLVLSDQIARSEDFRSLIEDIAQTERLYTATYTVICQYNASDFIKSLEASVGSRLSLDIPARFENHAEQGLITAATLADIYYLTESIYSDPMVSIMDINDDQKEAPSSGMPFTKTYFASTAILKNGRLDMELNQKESILANLLRNEVKYFRYEINDTIIEAAPSTPARLKVDLKSNPIRISVNLTLNIGTQADMPDEDQIKRTFERDISLLIQKAQENGIEPFGFSKIAAKKFLTIHQWQEYNWQNAYAKADISVKVNLTRWDA